MENDSPVTHEYSAPVYSAAGALANVQATNAASGARVITPLWYHPILGLIQATFVLLIGLEIPDVVRLPILLVCLVGIGLLVSAYRKVSGVWVGTLSAGPRAKKPWIVYVVVVIIFLLVAVISRESFALTWPVIAAAVGTFLATVILGPLVDRGLRADIAAGEGGLQK